jgi:tetratricopeptide (TPR) repeat protein
VGPLTVRLLGISALLVCFLIARPSARAEAVGSLLDRYLAGGFSAVVSEIEKSGDYNGFYKALQDEAPAWIEAGEPDSRSRRKLAAATLALEVARAGTFDDWKLVQLWMRLENIYWRAPPKLIEWACELLRADGPPTETERLWHLAALAVASRAGDFEFLIGSPWEERANPNDEILHLEHSAERFPTERRFALAQGIAIEWRLFPSRRSGFREAQQVFQSLKDEAGVGPEASVRLGVHFYRGGNFVQALETLARADERTREPYVVYLARYFRGQVFERQKKLNEAEAAYRGALAVIPAAQSASFALSAILAQRGERAEAATLIERALYAKPRPLDPWRAYGQADERFWPELLARLHAEIAR